MHNPKTPIIFLVVLGFSVPFVFFWIHPIFFSSSEMNLVYTVPRMSTVGHDFLQVHGFAKTWAILEKTPYTGENLYPNPYPPLATVFFTPLAYLDFRIAYILLTLLTLAAYTGFSLLIPMLILKKRASWPVVVFLFATGLFSYGFQFEIERGQFNVIAIFFCFWSIYLFHHHPRYRYLAYALFSLSIQLKLYPAIFVFTFVRSGQAWKENLTRFFSLGLVNILLLFALGWDIFMEYFSLMLGYLNQTYIWEGNHSIASFAGFVQQNLEKFAENQSYISHAILKFAPVSEGIVFTIMIFSFLWIFLRMVRQNTSGLQPSLLFICAIGACIIPATSHDYKLAILAGPTAILLGTLHLKIWKSPRETITAVTIILLSLNYSIPLFPISIRPLIYQNSFPFLTLMLLCMLGLMALEKSVEVS